MSTTLERDQVVTTLRDPQARKAFVAEEIASRLPMKIRSLRIAQGLSQQQLARRMGKKQTWVSKLEDPNYAGFSLRTLLEMACALEVGLEVDFVAFSRLLDRALNFSEADLHVPRFREEFPESVNRRAVPRMTAGSFRDLPICGNEVPDASVCHQILGGRSDLGVVSNGGDGRGVEGYGQTA